VKIMFAIVVACVALVGAGQAAASSAPYDTQARAVRAGVNLFGCYRWSVERHGPPHRYLCMWQTRADAAVQAAHFVVYRLDPDCVTVVRRYTRHYY